MELTINERFAIILKHYNYNAFSLSKALGYNSNTKIQRLIGTTNSPSIGLLVDLHHLLPDLNFEWLLLGTGNMLKNETLTKNDYKKMNELLIHNIELSKELVNMLSKND